MQHTASVERSTLSTLSTLTKIRSLWSDHVWHPQVQFCHEDPELAFLTAAVPALLLHGTGDAAACVRSAIDCRVHFLTDCEASAISCLICCCDVNKSVALARSAAAAAADLEGLQLTPLAMSLIGAPLPCQMDVYFATQLEPTRTRWKSDQKHTTTL